MVLSEEDVADLIADLERAKREVGVIKAKIRECEAELERLQKKRSLGTPLSETFFGGDGGVVEEWLQSDRMRMPMFSLSEGPQQSAPTAVALAAAAPAAEAMTGTHVFPDTAAPDASMARAARKRGSVAGSSSAICRERRTFRYYNSS